MRGAGGLLAALAVALVLLAAPPAAPAAPLSGVQVDAVSPRDAPADIDRELAAITAADGTIIRVEVPWSLLEPRASGRRDEALLRSLDHLIGRAAQRGIKVLMFVDRSPCWASSFPRKGNCSAPDANRFAVTRYAPSETAGYVSVAMFLAARYGERLAAFEIWNEPDQANEKFWAGPDKVARYVALVKATYGPLKRVNPGLQVLAGSFVGTDGRWLRAMYRAGIQGHYDGLAVHFYDLPLRALQTTHAVQVAHGDGKPLWLTEFGWTSCYRRGGPAIGRDHPCVTRALQGTALADVFRAVARTPWIAAAIVYTLHDEDADYRFGLLDRRGRRKPSFAAVRRALHSPLAPMTRPTLALRRAGRRVVVSGRGSLADVYLVEASVNGTLRYRAYVRTSRLGGWELTLPAALGTTGVRVTVTSDWTRASAARRL